MSDIQPAMSLNVFEVASGISTVLGLAGFTIAAGMKIALQKSDIGIAQILDQKGGASIAEIDKLLRGLNSDDAKQKALASCLKWDSQKSKHILQHLKPGAIDRFSRKIHNIQIIRLLSGLVLILASLLLVYGFNKSGSRISGEVAQKLTAAKSNLDTVRFHEVRPPKDDSFRLVIIAIQELAQRDEKLMAAGSDENKKKSVISHRDSAINALRVTIEPIKHELEAIIECHRLISELKNESLSNPSLFESEHSALVILTNDMHAPQEASSILIKILSGVDPNSIRMGNNFPFNAGLFANQLDILRHQIRECKQKLDALYAARAVATAGRS